MIFEIFHYVANKDFHDVPNILSSKSFLCLYSSTANKNQEVERDLKPLFYLLVLLTFFQSKNTSGVGRQSHAIVFV